jgi:iron complex transport system ATP-binding protein
MEIISELVREKRISAVMAIHDLNLAARFTDKLVMLKHGKVYAAGEPDSLHNEANICKVYGIEAIVMNAMGKPYVVPVRSLSGGIACD